MKRKLLALSLLALASTAFANESEIREAMQKKFPQEKILSISKTPYSGLYEVAFDGQLVYTNDKASYLFVGSIYDLSNMQNLTEERAKKLYAVKFDQLPFQYSFKEVKGNGKRKLAIFTDPNCPYCKRLEKELTSLSDVTIYRFMLPILAGSTEKAKAVWCSADRAKAWTELLLQQVAPKPEKACDTQALEEVAKLAHKYRINGTPALIFEDGLLNPGYMPAAALDKQLTASTQK